MLQAYVGIVSQRGLELFCPEHPGTVQFLWRRVRRGAGRAACFWSVIPDEAATGIQHALRFEGPDVALAYLQSTVQVSGPLLPGDQ